MLIVDVESVLEDDELPLPQDAEMRPKTRAMMLNLIVFIGFFWFYAFVYDRIMDQAVLLGD